MLRGKSFHYAVSYLLPSTSLADGGFGSQTGQCGLASAWSRLGKAYSHIRSI